MKTRTAIFDAIEHNENGEPRAHLGASLIGDDCARKIWYSFYWWFIAKYSGRMLRLFRRGHIEEPFVADDLARIEGVRVVMVDPDTGSQFRLRDPEMPAFGGSMDGKVYNAPDAPGVWLGLEVKTMNTRSFKTMVRDGVKRAQPRHYTQNQTYLSLSNDLEGILYVAVCKETDELHVEIIEPDRDAQLEARETARYILSTQEPPDRLSGNPSWWECKTCQALEVCHYDAAPTPNCRNCSKVQARLTHGENKWICTFNGAELREEEQRAGCAHYLCNDSNHSSLRILA